MRCRTWFPVVDAAVVEVLIVVVGQECTIIGDRDLDRRERRSGGLSVVTVAGAGVEHRTVFWTDDFAVAHRHARSPVEPLVLVGAVVDPRLDIWSIIASDEDEFLLVGERILRSEQVRADIRHISDVGDVCSFGHRTQ